MKKLGRNSKFMKLILCDVDDVLLDWCSPFRHFMKEHGHEPVKERGNYDLTEIYGMTPADISYYVTKFNASALFADMQGHKSAHEVLPELRNSGWRFRAITSCLPDDKDTPETKRVAAARMSNLNRVFGQDFFEHVHMIPVGWSKNAALNKYRNSRLPWIEDNSRHAIVGDDLGLSSYFMKKPWNSGAVLPSTIRQVENWYEMAMWLKLDHWCP